MMYEWKGYPSPSMGWRYSKETMAKLDEEGRIWYPGDTAKRPRAEAIPGRTYAWNLGHKRVD